MTWHDRRLLPGQKFDEIIDKEIVESDIILLLISASFINSDYCYNIELKKAIERHENNEATVVPILLSECVWNRAPFAKIVMANEDATPIDNVKYWTLNEALSKTAANIGRLVDSIKERKSQLQLVVQDEGLLKVVSEEPVEELVSDKVDDVRKAFEVFKQEFDKLDYKSSSEDFSDVEELKRKLLNEIFIPFDDKLKNIPSLRSKMPQILFERIYALDFLDMSTILDIQKVRDNKVLYNWYERKIVINSITLSLISSKKFDSKKANLLIDFLTDFEQDVWQSALTGLVLALIHHPNKWERFSDLKKRLETLKDLEEVQKGLNTIDYILRMKLFESSTFNPKLFGLSFFDTPMNCFLPFYPNNPVLDSAINNTEEDIDPDEFTKYVTSLPFLDCYKYSLCIALEEGAVSRGIPIKERSKVLNNLKISSLLHPYQNILCEYFNYFNFYPKSNIADIFSTQVSIAKTKLKSVILNKVNELEITGNVCADEKNFRGAINYYNDVIKIEPQHFRANWKAANSYLSLNKPEPHNSLKYLRVLESKNENDPRVLALIAKCEELLGRDLEALQYLYKANSVNGSDKVVVNQLGELLAKLKRHEDAVDVFEKGSIIHPSDCGLTINLGQAYLAVRNLKAAFTCAKKALDICDEELRMAAYGLMRDYYFDAYQFDDALKYAELIAELDSNKATSLMSIGRIYLLGGIDYAKAKQYLERSISKKKLGVTYGNLGHMELLNGHKEKAMSYYKACIEAIKDIEDFRYKMNVDVPFMVRLGISESEMNQIEHEIILEFERLKKAH
ncbi:hypothetical protein GCM10028822_27030 [Hymenobacter terrigena]